MHRNQRFASALLAAAIFAAVPATAGGRAYDVVDLGTLGGNQSFALDVNERGQTTGNARTTDGTLPLFAFFHDGDGMVPILPLQEGSRFSRGYAINDRGQVVGESDNDVPRAFLWEDGTARDLGTLGGRSAVAHDVNDRGQVVGASSNGIVTRPFLWEKERMLDLGTLRGTDDSFGRAWAINARGDAAGVSRNRADTASQATLWPRAPKGGIVALGSLEGGDQFSQAFAVNARGWVVGESALSDGSYRAFLWRAGAMEDLGTIEGFRFARAIDVNARGDVVGHAGPFYNFPTLGGRAVLWRNGELADLNDLIDPDSGWVLRSAEGISESGDVVGYGTFEGATRAFRLVPRGG
jgi:probable HAF family extracellular repeat protein